MVVGGVVWVRTFNFQYSTLKEEVRIREGEMCESWILKIEN